MKILKIMAKVPVTEEFWMALVWMSGMYYIALLLSEVIGFRYVIESMGYSCVIMAALFEGIRAEAEKQK